MGHGPSLAAAGNEEPGRRAVKPERWQEVKKVLAAALEREPGERGAYLDQACTEPLLRRELESLNHPNIATIHGLEESDGVHYLVMELVPGETLAERIGKGALPVEEALKVAGQVAQALEAAHEKGVIHRDLKPGNVKLTPEG